MGFGCCLCNEALYQKTKSTLIVGDTSKTERPVVASKCGHLFHNDCLKDWFIKQGGKVWTTRNCPKCDMTMIVATDIIRLCAYPVDGESDDIEDANLRIKKMQNDKDELVKRLESSFLQSRDQQKLYKKLEKDYQKRRNHEVNLKEEISLLRKENEELKNTVVRMSQNMSNRVEQQSAAITAAAVGFKNGSIIPPQPPPFYNYPPAQIYRQNFQTYPHPYAIGVQIPQSDPFGSYFRTQDAQCGGYMPSTPCPNANRTHVAAKVTAKSKYDYYSAEYNNANKNGKTWKYLSQYDSNSEEEQGKRNRSTDDSKLTEDKNNAEKFYAFLRNSGSPGPGTGKKSSYSTSTTDEKKFDSFFRNNTESDMMKFIEEEQSILVKRLASQNLNTNENSGGWSGKRIFGKYKCSICGSKWGSAKSEENQMQICVKCKVDCYPYEQGPVLSKTELRQTRKRF